MATPVSVIICSHMIGESTYHFDVVALRSVIIAALGMTIACLSSGQIRGLNGTWKLNLDKTTGPHAKSEMLTFAVSGDEEHYTVDEVETDGSLFKTEYTAKFDGKSLPQQESRNWRNNVCLLEENRRSH